MQEVYHRGRKAQAHGSAGGREHCGGERSASRRLDRTREAFDAAGHAAAGSGVMTASSACVKPTH